jgi:hypothetical protein
MHDIPCMQSATPIEYVISDAPLPARKYSPGRPVVQRRRMFDLLGTMEAGGAALDVNRSLRSIQEYVVQYRSSDMCEGIEVQFTARRLKPGWTRIWRVK